MALIFLKAFERKFYDIEWAIKVYGLGDDIQETTNYNSWVCLGLSSCLPETRIGCGDKHFWAQKLGCTK